PLPHHLVEIPIRRRPNASGTRASVGPFALNRASTDSRNYALGATNAEANAAAPAVNFHYMS
uniref:Uncharacterized protein n=1 Tax=Romanomermis culicivorax TaxID=13658 RepID=A0A915HG00_ROMCU